MARARSTGPRGETEEGLVSRPQWATRRAIASISRAPRRSASRSGRGPGGPRKYDAPRALSGETAKGTPTLDRASFGGTLGTGRLDVAGIQVVRPPQPGTGGIPPATASQAIALTASPEDDCRDRRGCPGD